MPSYTAPHTIAAGEVVTIGTMNTEWGGNTAFLANPPACRVYNNAALSIPNAAFTPLTFNSERYDTNSMHSTSSLTSRITINTAGLYLLTGHVSFAASAIGERIIEFWANAATELGIMRIDAEGSDWAGSIATVWKFAAGDYVELRAYQTSGGALNVQSTAAQSPEFSATWVGLG